jgi:hypothetical protein
MNNRKPTPFVFHDLAELGEDRLSLWRGHQAIIRAPMNNRKPGSQLGENNKRKTRASGEDLKF